MSTIEFADGEDILIRFDLEKQTVETFADMQTVAKTFWAALDLVVAKNPGNKIVEFSIGNTSFLTVDTRTRKINHVFEGPNGFMILWTLEQMAPRYV